MTKSNDTDREREEAEAARSAEAQAALNLASDTLSGDIRDFLLDRVKNLGKPWAAMTEDEQREQILQAKEAAERVVREVCKIIAAKGKKHLSGKLVKIAIKDKVQCQIDFNKEDEQIHELIDAQGLLVAVILADASPFTAERGPAEPTPTQGDLLGNAKRVKEKDNKVTRLKA